MIDVSEDFKAAARAPVKELRASLTVVSDTEEPLPPISSDDDLAGFKIEATADLLKTGMRKLSGRVITDQHNLVGRFVKPSFGLLLPDGESGALEEDPDALWEDINYGSFLITEQTADKENGTMTFTGYDLMINAYTEYSADQHEYPCTLSTFLQQVCDAIGVQNAMDGESFINDDLEIEIDYYELINNTTYRDILQEIAEVTCSTIMIGADDKLYLRPITPTGEELDDNTLRKLKLEQNYGIINSVVLSRMPQEDNIALFDDESGAIEAGELTEFKIINNQLIDKRREDVIQSIFDGLYGISFAPFDANTIGLGWYEIGDQITIENAETEFDCVIFNYTIDLMEGFKERLYTEALTKTQTNYQRAGSMTKRVNNTEIIVDKQQQYIESVVTDMYEEEGLINEKFTQVYQDIDGITSAVQSSGGVNLLRNSVGYAVDDTGALQSWTPDGGGAVSAVSSPQARNAGSISGNTIILSNKSITQRVPVRPDHDSIPENEKTYYSFSLLVKKNIVGTGYVRISNENEEYQIDFENGIELFYQSFGVSELLPKSSYYDIEIFGDADSGLTVTDVMFAVGKYRSPWQQANGETMNTQVNISIDGILVRSSIYAGDYTIMSPLEFSGYSMVGGMLTKVFTLNKDRTEVTKLLSKNEITMPPIKIVPITTGSHLGWAFVSAEGEV